MTVPFVDLKEQYESIRPELESAAKEVFDQSQFIGGSVVSAFESAFANYVGVNHCVGCGNGTDALEIALQALGIGSGDEVIVPALTWISTASAVTNVGAQPVFADVLPGECTLNPELIDRKATERTKAVIPVHLYGLPARMDEILTVAKKRGLKVIEDCAQAHGAAIEGRKVGSFGDVATFSFYPSKNLGAYGDGGAIVTNDQELAERSKRIGNHGQLTKHDHSIIARNSRLDPLQAAYLKVKLQHLDTWNDRRMELASYYSKNLIGVETPEVPMGFKPNFHLYTIRTKDRSKLVTKLEKAKIGYGIHYPVPLPFTDLYRKEGHQVGDFPIAERICQEVISLPMYPELKEEQADQVIKVVNETVE